MKKGLPALAAVLTAALLVSAAGCDGGNWYDKDIWMEPAAGGAPTQAYVLPGDPGFATEAAVHDPSVFWDSATGKYYAFGSHYAVASSTDLISWKQEQADSDKSTKNALFGETEVKKVFPKTLEEIATDENGLNGTATLDAWAPDVMKIGDFYYMYLSFTERMYSNHSIIVRVRSGDVMGPYFNEEVIVTANGASATDPNCIDPELFYDKEGKLWMVYGSFFGGVYIKELNDDGLPKEDGFGKLLWKGDDVGVEGPFIFYNAELDYYYLMTSDGNLLNSYNMRVARSKSPDGPYEDVSGQDMATRSGDAGNKLTGNYRFAGDEGYGALGHNSVIKKDGKYLVVYHTRYEENGGISLRHNLRTSQLYFDEEGWPVLSPDRYAGETKGAVTMAQAAGDYDVIVLSGTTGTSIVPSVRYTFTEAGKITSGGSEVGEWSVSQDYYVTISLNKTDYYGVIAPAWRNYGTKKGILCMTASSMKGDPIWLNAAD